MEHYYLTITFFLFIALIFSSTQCNTAMMKSIPKSVLAQLSFFYRYFSSSNTLKDGKEGTLTEKGRTSFKGSWR